jgi:hypothetical protein
VRAVRRAEDLYALLLPMGAYWIVFYLFVQVVLLPHPPPERWVAAGVTAEEGECAVEGEEDQDQEEGKEGGTGERAKGCDCTGKTGKAPFVQVLSPTISIL